MKNLKLFSIIAIMAIFAACTNQDPTIIKFNKKRNITIIAGQMDTTFTYSDTVAVSNGKGEITFYTNSDVKLEQKKISKDSSSFSITITLKTLNEVKIAIEVTNNGVTNVQNITINPKGTEFNPYSVADAIANQGSRKWVCGFIVGYVKADKPYDYIFSANGCDNNTNLLIAASATETDKAKCLPVQLLNTAIRNGLNLVDNENLFKTEVLLYGSLETYFNLAGLKSTSFAQIIGTDTKFGTHP